MHLPQIVVPEYNLKLPLTNKEVRYRGFLSKEERILLMAIENFNNDKNDSKSLIDATIRIAQNCILTEGINVKELPTVDLEYLFLNIRKKSIGESVEVMVAHNHEGCKHQNKITVDLDETEIKTPEEHNKRIELNSTSGLILKYPTVEATLSQKSSESNIENFYNFIIKSIDVIYNGDDFTKASDYEESALRAWIDTFPPEVTKKIFKFFDTMPHLLTKIEYVCDGCGKKEAMDIVGTSNFFT